MRTPLQLLGLGLALGLATPLAVGADLRDLYFGEALYHAYQGQYFDAIQRLDTELAQYRGLDEPGLDTLHHHINDAEFSVGDFELNYRMHHRAGRAIKAVLEGSVDEAVRNEAAFRLARIHFQKDQLDDALHALARIEGTVPEEIRDERLGADARFSDADDVSQGQASSRSMLTTNAPGSSGGINIASLSRNVGGGGGDGAGGGGGMHGVQIGRATSSIASIGGSSRPLARGGPGLSRTDEEIQIVFDRYKASFYRIYNRELRNDPTLRGQMVLRLTIEPDGSVSMCKLQSSDMDAPELAAQVVNRILTINFGAKDGVQALTIVYPIDFLPAAETGG